MICASYRRRQWHPTLVLLPGRSHGRRSLVGCSPWGRQSRARLSDFTFTFHFHALACLLWASQVALVVKNTPANAGDMRRRFDAWVRKIPWRRKWQPTPVFLPGESQGRGSLVGCHLWGHTESDTTEVTQQQQGWEYQTT